MKKLTNEEIERFAHASTNKDAVWNFLGTAHHCGNYVNAVANLLDDAALYGWNNLTVMAIYEGLKYANLKN